MIFREAFVADIKQIQVVRHSVTENRLSDPALVTDQDCEEYLTARGKGWVCEVDAVIVGFAIADLKENNIWALFVQPGYAGRGMGKQLHRLMLDWYFGQTDQTVWLSTAPDTKAARFYALQGWKETGKTSGGEIRFEMSRGDWEIFLCNVEKQRSDQRQVH